MVYCESPETTVTGGSDEESETRFSSRTPAVSQQPGATTPEAQARGIWRGRGCGAHRNDPLPEPSPARAEPSAGTIQVAATGAAGSLAAAALLYSQLHGYYALRGRPALTHAPSLSNLRDEAPLFSGCSAAWSHRPAGEFPAPCPYPCCGSRRGSPESW